MDGEEYDPEGPLPDPITLKYANAMRKQVILLSSKKRRGKDFEDELPDAKKAKTEELTKDALKMQLQGLVTNLLEKQLKNHKFYTSDSGPSVLKTSEKVTQNVFTGLFHDRGTTTQTSKNCTQVDLNAEQFTQLLAHYNVTMGARFKGKVFQKALKVGGKSTLDHKGDIVIQSLSAKYKAPSCTLACTWSVTAN